MFFNFAQFFASQGPNLAYEEFLSRGELSLADILRHEDTVSEVRKNNAALLRIVKGEIPTLLGFISVPPEPQDYVADERSFPFVSSEILKSEALLSEFGRNPELLPLVFNFLQTEGDLNPTVAGYCSDLCLKLLDRPGFHAVDCVLRGEVDYCTLLARHARQRSVAELIVGVLSVNTLLQQRQRLLSAVLARLRCDSARDEAVNVGFIVSEVLRKSVEVGEWRYLTALLLSKNSIETLSAAASSEVAGDQVGTVMTALLSHTNFDEVVGCQSEEFELYERLKPLLETALQGLPRYSGFDYCECTVPLGQARLALIQMINAGVKVLGPELDGLLIEYRYLHTVTQLFLAYPWHSSLHHAFESLVRTVVEDSSHCLRVELMEKLALISVLVGATKANTVEPRKRKGYMGHITRVGNLLLAASSTSPYLRELMAQGDWQYFSTFHLAAQNRVELEKYLASEKDSDCSSVEVLRDVEVLPDSGEEYEFKLEPQLLSLDTDFAGFECDLVSSDPEVEAAQGSDIYNSLNYWELPIPAEALPDLD